MIIPIYIFVFLSIALIIWGVSAPLKYSSARLQLPRVEGDSKGFKFTSFLTNVCPFSPAILDKLHLDIKIKNKLDAAHVSLTPQ